MRETSRAVDKKLLVNNKLMLGSTEAIEDLGVYVNVSMLESTEAFQKFANGKSWRQLDFQTQQQIRLMSVLEQTYARYGTTLADTTQSRHNQFIASLKNVQLALGQAFLPIYNAVLPPLTTFMNTLAKAISVISAFTTAIFGKPNATKQQTNAINEQASAISGLSDSLGDTSNNLNKTATSAKKAKKEIGGLIGGLDEINNLSVSTTAGSDGSDDTSSTSTPTVGGLGNLDTIDMGEAIDTSGLDAKVEKIKATFDKIKKVISDNKEIIIALCAGLMAGLGVILVSKWGAIASSFATHFPVLSKVISTLAKVVTKPFALLKNGITALAGLHPVVLVIATVIGVLVGAITYLWRTNEDFRNKVIKTWKAIKDALEPWIEGFAIIFKVLAEVLITVLGAAFKLLGKIILEVVGFLVGKSLDDLQDLAPIIKELGENFKKFAKNIELGWNITKKYFEELGKVFKNEGFLAGIKKLLIDGVLGLINLLPDNIKKPLEKIAKKFAEFVVKTNFYWKKIKAAFTYVNNYVKKYGIVKTVQKLFNNLKKKVKDKLKEMKNEFIKKVKDYFKEMAKTVRKKWEELIKSVVDFVIDIKSKVEDFKEKVAEKWDETKDWTKDKVIILASKVEDFKEDAEDKWNTASNWFKENVLGIETEVEEFEPKVSEELDKASETTGKKKLTVKNVVEDMKGNVEKAFKIASDWVGQQKVKIGNKVDEMKGNVKKAWELANNWINQQKLNISNKVEDIKTKVSNNLAIAKNWITSQFLEVRSKVRPFYDQAVNSLNDAKRRINSWFLEVRSKVRPFYDQAKAGFNIAKNNIKNWFLEVRAKVGSFYDKVKESFNIAKKNIKTWAFEIALKVNASANNIKDVINGIIKQINNAVFAKIKITVPSWVPGFGGKTWGPPKGIPYLAKGGIIDSPTLAMVGEAGRKILRSIVEMRYKKYSVNSWKAKS